MGIDTQKKDNHVKTEVEIRVNAVTSERKPSIAASFQKLGGRHGTDSSLQPAERTWSFLHFDLVLLASRIERINFCCLRPPGLWYFVTAA